MKPFVIAALFGLFGTFLFYARSKNNVCKTFADYYTNRDSNKNCFYNPDYRLETPGIIRRYGYEVETHNVTTEDGYVLSMFRIPPRKGTRGKPVFLQHGYAANSEVYVWIGKKSLAFVLAAQGYDVWLGNSRGTKYSMNHTTLSTSNDEYWNFSFDELGLYDLPACLSYIRNFTKQKITYVGLSLGTVIMYVYSLSFPENADYQVNMFINLAPGIFFKEYGFVLRFIVENWEYIEPTWKILEKTKSIWSPVLSPLAKFVCFPFPFQIRICMLPLMAMFGFNYGQHDPETLPLVLLSTLEHPALKTFTHGVQVAQTGMLSRFDYGNQSNLQIYGSEQPPSYNFSKMKVPVYLLRAKNDKVVTKKNVDVLYEMLPKEVTTYGIYSVEDDDFNHVDFVFGKDVVELVYNHLVDFLNALP